VYEVNRRKRIDRFTILDGFRYGVRSRVDFGIIEKQALKASSVFERE